MTKLIGQYLIHIPHNDYFKAGFFVKRFLLSGHVLIYSLYRLLSSSNSLMTQKNVLVDEKRQDKMPFLGSSTSPQQTSMTLEQQQLFIFEPYSFHRSSDTWQKGPTFFLSPWWNCLTPRMLTLQMTSPDHVLVWGTSSGAWSTRCCAVCPRRAKRLWIDCSIAQSTYCFLNPIPQKTIWHGHAPMDINNWKVSWSYQVYFRETRAIQWFSAYLSSEIPLPPALWLLVGALLKFYPLTSRVQFNLPHSCKMW